MRDTLPPDLATEIYKSLKIYERYPASKAISLIQMAVAMRLRIHPDFSWVTEDHIKVRVDPITHDATVSVVRNPAPNRIHIDLAITGIPIEDE